MIKKKSINAISSEVKPLWVKKLQQYMESYNYTQRRMAKAIGVSPTMLQKYFFHNSSPQIDIQERIIAATKGFITKEDFNNQVECTNCNKTKLVVHQTIDQVTPVIKLIIAPEIQTTITECFLNFKTEMKNTLQECLITMMPEAIQIIIKEYLVNMSREIQEMLEGYFTTLRSGNERLISNSINQVITEIRKVKEDIIKEVTIQLKGDKSDRNVKGVKGNRGNRNVKGVKGVKGNRDDKK